MRYLIPSIHFILTTIIMSAIVLDEMQNVDDWHNVTNVTLLKFLTTTLLKNSATAFSINKFFNDVRSQGYKISKVTLYNYMEYLEDAFLVFTVPCYSELLRKSQNMKKKYMRSTVA